ncbi:hypothetical protein SORBI_3002G013850 [Sorghum bicolor]|uniref:Uncharacterized protein n=1 Tax=Sorghum bicolor TaxID=4558 RepID=A0A1W0W1Q6_SORBI|nr:hypothetical protein SORBI_3002G013850 [Sorghum bicolor]
MPFCSSFFFIQEASMSTPGHTRDGLSDIINVTAKDEASSRRAQTSQGRNRRVEIIDERREEINRRQHEY